MSRFTGLSEKSLKKNNLKYEGNVDRDAIALNFS